MPSRTGHPGTRRAHMRKGKPVRSASIKHPQTQRRRNQVSRQVRQGRKPLLWGAGTLAGLGALEAILGGRFFTAAMLFGLAGGFLVGHFAWEHHKKRQASKPARVSAAEQRRQALAKAREQEERTAFAAERKRAWSREGLKEFWRGEDPRPVEPAGTRRAPTKNGAYKQPPLSSDDSEEPIGPRPEPLKRAVPQTDGTVANLYTPRKTTRKAKPAAWWPKQPREGTRAAIRFHQLRGSGYTGAIGEDGWAMTDIEVAREQARRRGEKPREGAK